MENFSVNKNQQQVEVEYVEDRKLYENTKRVIDIIFSSIALVFSIPIILITCVLVRLESKGKTIFKQERTGKHGEIFYLYKIRSMYIDAEKHGPKWADKNDIRVTRVGKFIRKTRLDELPQLYNILKGDMSLVGPRPEREVFIKQFEKTIPNFRQRLQIKPGLTGLAQVSGGYEISPSEKLKWDLIYIKERNLILDLEIILKTVFVVFTGHGAR